MAKKKEEKEQSSNGELEAIQAQLTEINKTLDNFRTSFQNLETALRTLKERNRLR
jgi:prefoldin subunit 5